MNKTGWPPGLMQDDCRKLSKWLANQPGAQRQAWLVSEEIKEQKMTEEQQPEALRLAAYLAQFKSPDAQRAAAEMQQQHARIAELEKQVAAYRSLQEAMDARMAAHNEQLAKAREAVNSLQFERNANTILTNRIDVLEAQLEAVGAGGVSLVRPSEIAPAGYVLVPLEPTAEMIVNGFESAPDPHFTKEVAWDEYERMTGCQQAAHRAKLCWTAMLAAAPQPAEQGATRG